MQLSPQEIGQKIKEVRKEYSSLDPNILGVSYIKKYGQVNAPDSYSPEAPQTNQPTSFGGNIMSKILGGITKVTQAFGNKNPIEKYSGGVNYGTDFRAKVGTPVNLPAGDWQVLESNSQGGMNRGYGNSILVKNKQTGEKLRFSHLSKVGVQQGQTLKGGQIGLTGDTGNVTGPHLDLELYDKAGRIANVLNSAYKSNL